MGEHDDEQRDELKDEELDGVDGGYGNTAPQNDLLGTDANNILGGRNSALGTDPNVR